MKAKPKPLTFRPSAEQIAAADGATILDVIAPHLQILFCGINPGLYSAAIGHHFGRPGNRFWPILHAAGYTPRLLSPFEDRDLLAYGYGITNLVARATATAAELSATELAAGGQRLRRLVSRYRPTYVAVVGITAYRTAFNRPRATLGLQDERLGQSGVWALPNPSGLNAHYRLAELVALFGQLRRALGAST